MTQFALLGLGSNVEPERHIVAMVSRLSEQFGQIWVSSASRTRPVGVGDADDFLNVVVGIQSAMDGRSLKMWTKEQEKLLGRDHGNPMEHRRVCIADLDILTLWHSDDHLCCASAFVDEPFFVPLANEVLALMNRGDTEHPVSESVSPLEYRVKLQLLDGRYFGLVPVVMATTAASSSDSGFQRTGNR